MATNPFPRQPVPMLDLCVGDKILSKIQSKTPLVQLEAISSCAVACFLGEETNPLLVIISFQGVVGSDKVPPEPSFLQAEHLQLP